MWYGTDTRERERARHDRIRKHTRLFFHSVVLCFVPYLWKRYRQIDWLVLSYSYAVPWADFEDMACHSFGAG